MNLEQSLKTFALETGFVKMGIVPAESLTCDGDRAFSWIKQGYAGDMGYMKSFHERQARFLSRVPWVKSAVIFACAYPGKLPAMKKNTSCYGRVARYAWGKNYHKVLLGKLDQVISFLKIHSNPRELYQPFADTAPILERTVAREAGLGFIGKNTTLILPGLGSYFFLCGIVTSLSLSPDAPPAKPFPRGGLPPTFFGCGSCEKCLKACPTGALRSPYKLDARRCISYLTIEHKGTVPERFRDKMGRWVFGCDLCQEACPHNQRVLKDTLPELSPACGPGPELLLAKVLSLRTDEEFLKAFAGTSLMRSKRTGLLRNAAIAAGNAGRSRLASSLCRALDLDADPMVRAHSAWALGKIPSPKSLEGLKQSIEKEASPKVLKEIRRSLSKLKTKKKPAVYN